MLSQALIRNQATVRRLRTFYWTPLVLSLLLAFAASSAYAQNSFNSGSTGADGAFAPTASQTLTIPPSGVFNFTTVDIPAGVTITFTRNANNTPVTILASGDVTINGTISVDGADASASGFGGPGGPGGFNGANGVSNFDTFSGDGLPGDGPGGGLGAPASGFGNSQSGGGAGFAQAGQSSQGFGGPIYGSSTLLPLIGGSGGGSGGANSNARSGGGGGGGGAILIASSTTITLGASAIISSKGGLGSNGICAVSGYGGSGSGGAIRIVANNLTGTGTLRVNGGVAPQIPNCAPGNAGGTGYIRTEAYNFSGFAPTASPGFSSDSPNPVQLNNGPQILIASVAGVAAPTNPKGSFQSDPDVVVPTTQTNPVSVVLNGTNVPPGTPVDVIVKAHSGTSTTTQVTLVGASAATTSATASVNLANGVSVITAKATITLTTSNKAPIFIQGEAVDKVEITAVFGGASGITYITKSGRRIAANAVQ